MVSNALFLPPSRCCTNPATLGIYKPGLFPRSHVKPQHDQPNLICGLYFFRVSIQRGLIRGSRLKDAPYLAQTLKLAHKTGCGFHPR